MVHRHHRLHGLRGRHGAYFGERLGRGLHRAREQVDGEEGGAKHGGGLGQRQVLQLAPQRVAAAQLRLPLQDACLERGGPLYALQEPRHQVLQVRALGPHARHDVTERQLQRQRGQHAGLSVRE